MTPTTLYRNGRIYSQADPRATALLVRDGRIDWLGVTLIGTALILLNVGLGTPELGVDGASAAAPDHRLYWVAAAAATLAVFNAKALQRFTWTS